jgi:hypothetical protein
VLEKKPGVVREGFLVHVCMHTGGVREGFLVHVCMHIWIARCSRSWPIVISKDTSALTLLHHRDFIPGKTSRPTNIKDGGILITHNRIYQYTYTYTFIYCFCLSLFIVDNDRCFDDSEALARKVPSPVERGSIIK